MKSYPLTHLKTALVLAAFLGFVITALPARNNPETELIPVSLRIAPADRYPVPALGDDAPLVSEQVRDNWTSIEIRSGDNLFTIFKAVGLKAAELQAIVDIGKDVAILRKIVPGKTLGLKISKSGELDALRYDINALERLLVTRDADRFVAQREISNPEIITAYQTGRISTDTPSLYHAGKKAGLSDNIIMKLSNIFQWDISFALDLRKGDSFALIYEDIYVDGEKVKEGEVLAAQFQNMGKTYTAVLYEDEHGIKSYYAQDGRSMRKAFIRDPVHFSHVSSNFNLRRLHPIHNRVMPHRGIDYAANKGTPVIAAGQGKVTIARQNSASGRYVVIQHGEQYTTKYLHLSKFANGLRPGKTVEQGQIIGYVGATGWATAPHLHFEFLVNGVHRNPRTVKLPDAKPILAKNMTDFRNTTQPILSRLSSVAGQTSYASALGQSSNDGG